MTKGGASVRRIKIDENDTAQIAVTSARRGDSINGQCQISIKRFGMPGRWDKIIRGPLKKGGLTPLFFSFSSSVTEKFPCHGGVPLLHLVKSGLIFKAFARGKRL